MSHAPVLLDEVIAILAPRKGAVYLDATFGGGGYTRAILEAADCKVIAVDRDPEAFERAVAMTKDYPGRLFPVQGRFSNMEALAHQAGFEHVDGVAADFGVSSFQIDGAARGFSFMRDGPLDMRMDLVGPTAAQIVNKLGERELAQIFKAYGEERAANRIARAIVKARAEESISTTTRLANIIERAAPERDPHKHPATRVFQALRIFVNDELSEIGLGLAAAEHLLSPGGRLAVVAFHSLEDRIVKNFLIERSGKSANPSRHMPDPQNSKKASFRMLTKKTVTPGDTELENNPRARSGRLRAAERTDAPPFAEPPIPEAPIRLSALELAR